MKGMRKTWLLKLIRMPIWVEKEWCKGNDSLIFDCTNKKIKNYLHNPNNFCIFAAQKVNTNEPR